MWLAVPHRALNAIAIMAETPSALGPEVGVTKKMVHDTVELGLRRNKVRIEENPDFWTPRLVIKTGVIGATNGEASLYVYDVSFVLWVPVSVRPSPPSENQYVRTDLWRSGCTVFEPNEDRLPAVIRNYPLEQTDELSLDYHRAVTEREQAMERWIANIK